MTANNPTLDVAASPAAYTVRIRGSTSGDMWIVRAVSDRNSSWRALGEWHARLASRIVAARGWPAESPRHAAGRRPRTSAPHGTGPPNSTVSACENYVRGCEASASPSCDDGVQRAASRRRPRRSTPPPTRRPHLRSSSPRKVVAAGPRTSAGGHAGSPLAGARRKRPHGAAQGGLPRCDGRSSAAAPPRRLGDARQLLRPLRPRWRRVCAPPQLSADATTWTTANGTFGGGVPDVARVLFAEALGCDAGVACGRVSPTCSRRRRSGRR